MSFEGKFFGFSKLFQNKEFVCVPNWVLKGQVFFFQKICTEIFTVQSHDDIIKENSTIYKGWY